MDPDHDMLATRRRFLRRTFEGLLSTGWLALLSGCDLNALFEDIAKSMTTAEDQINAYRKQNNLPAIPASIKLGCLAFEHCIDIFANHPEKQCNGNYHSWSKTLEPRAKGGCYDPNNSATWPIMWDKPKELHDYPDNGFEIAVAGATTAAGAVAAWKNSPPHRDVILNQGTWTGYKWQALGGYIGNGFGCVWFGQTFDAG